MMLPFDNERWLQMKGGYRVLYDPRPALERLRAGDQTAFKELWNELHHQHDVDEASYAAVPHLIDIYRRRDVTDWQTYALIGTIELERGKGRNPAIPEWLRTGYETAWASVIDLVVRDLARTSDHTTVQAILGAIALAKGLRLYGKVLLEFGPDEMDEMVRIYESGDWWQ